MRPSDPAPPRAVIPEIAHSEGEMAARVRAFDWDRTPLGPMRTWPPCLRVAVGICLDSRFPMFVWWGPQLINIYNDGYIPMLGKRHPEALGRPAQGTWSDIWDVVGLQARAVMERGEATWNERVKLVMERHGYREETWFTWSYSPIHGETGRIEGLFCAVTEETGRVLAERERDRLLEEVQVERSRLADAFARAPTFLAVLQGPEHVFTLVNAPYTRLLGGRDLVGRPVREAVPEVAGQGFFEILDRVYATGEPFVGTGVQVELANEAGELERRYLDFVYEPMRAPGGAITGIMAHGVDVTERHETAERFRQLADAMPQIVIAADARGQPTYFNRQWYEYTGQSRGAPDWKRAFDPEHVERVVAAWDRAVASGQAFELEYPIRRHDGEYRWHLGRAVPSRDEQGRVVGWFGTNTDIHDRKQMEDALAQALQSEQRARGEAETASRMKDDFLATLSHELRTPLNAILGWSHILRREGATAEQMARGGEVIERNARAQSAIIEDLLDMSAIVSGKVRLRPEAVDLAALVRTGVEAARPGAEAKGVRLALEVDPPGDAPTVADAEPPAADRRQPAGQRDQVHPGGRARGRRRCGASDRRTSCGCGTRARGSHRSSCRRSSSASARPTPRARAGMAGSGWACRSSSSSRRCTAGGWRPTAPGAGRVPRSSSRCPWAARVAGKRTRSTWPKPTTRAWRACACCSWTTTSTLASSRSACSRSAAWRCAPLRTRRRRWRWRPSIPSTRW